ncbi:hypothetical protein GUJ93_ZPchr0006g41757 [Zizania palustris]|uniref:Uncharacterized protein n=1 Tax=Zizania palustris TaxID=103762 RepID=A0A8J5SN96_ZIZPA|nr:hypothetical protein GUJ93_ZPchr0006g41757 [Zizania palustris]
MEIEMEMEAEIEARISVKLDLMLKKMDDWIKRMDEEKIKDERRRSKSELWTRFAKIRLPEVEKEDLVQEKDLEQVPQEGGL